MKGRVISALATGMLAISLLASATGVTLARTDDKSQSTPVPQKAGSPGSRVTTVPDATEAQAGTGFTYQGSLKDGGSPANGQYDLQFTLFEASTGGSQVGNPIIMTGQMVSNGLFTVQLDFGSSAFVGSSRWLEIAVKPSSGGNFSTLSPRQALTAAPYAMSLVPGAMIIGDRPSGWGVVEGHNTGAGHGLYGESAGTPSDAGVFGVSSSANGNGVLGVANNGPVAWGVGGSSTSGIGVHGASSATNTGGVVGENFSGFGVIGNGYTGVSGTGSSGDGVRGLSTAGFGGNFSSNSSYGVYGQSNNEAAGVFSSTTSYGVFGRTVSGRGGSFTSSSGIGLYGHSNSADGILGEGYSGVIGVANQTDGNGLLGIADSGSIAYGVWGISASGYAGYFSGNVNVTGNLSKGGGSFKIDDPIDPANKYLYHSFVESPDMMNIYNGNVTTDAKGEATIQMPSYFEALNRDFRYQLTPIGQFAQAMISQEIDGSKFKIKTDKPNVKVSWQVTGVRQDPYANAHRIPVEEEKPADEKGKYLYPTEYGQPESKGIDYAKHQQLTMTQPQPTPPAIPGGK